MGQTAVIPPQIVDVAARSLLGNNTASAAACQTISFSAASAGQVLTVQGDGSVAFAAVSAGIGGSTGSTDNAVLRADGIGGATLQSSGWIVPDIFTASPNATVNHLSLQATGSSTNVSVSIVPKGTGAFSLAVPDGTTAGGNARGANAVDLRTTARSAAADVASGSASFLGPSAVRASGNNSACIFGEATGDFSFSAGVQGIASGGYSGNLGGRYSEATGTYALAGGEFNRAQSQDATAIGGGENTASAAYSSVFGGYRAVADRYGMDARASGRFAAAGDCQRVQFTLRNTTTTNSAVTLFLDGSSARLTIPSGKALHGTLHVLGAKAGGTAIASYMRQVTIANVTGTTSLVGTVNTIGVDEAAGTSLAVTADNTNDALQVAPTGVLNENWRWFAVFYGIEMAWG